MRAAVLFRGYAHRETGCGRDYGTDWRLCVSSHRSMLLEPLTERYETDTFLSTYQTPFLRAVERDYKPKAVQLNPTTNLQPHTAVAGLRLVESFGIYDLVVVVRFDLELRRVPIRLPGFDTDKVNFIWREEKPERWERDREVGDAVIMLHGRHLSGFRIGVEGMTVEPNGWMHAMYRPVVAEIGSSNLKVMDENYVNSNSDMVPNYLYRIVRVWPVKPKPVSRRVPTGRRSGWRARIAEAKARRA